VIRRREFIAGVTATSMPVLWPFSTRAQPPNMPVIGFLNSSSPEAAKGNVSDFRSGLRDAGYIEGQNVAIEFRWGKGQLVMLPLASDLVRLQVAVIVAAGAVNSQLAAKDTTSTIPIVMIGGVDPVKWGLVDSLNRPGGNITGVTTILNQLAGKHLDLLLKLVPEATTVGYLVGNQSGELTNGYTGELERTAQTLGRQIVVVGCRRVSDFEAAFATLIEHHAGALVVSAQGLFDSNRGKILELAARHKIPAIYPQFQYAYEGGLMSYGTAPIYRQVAAQYVAPILKGAKPADLPIRRPTNFILVINSKTAKALGLEIPPVLLVQATQVIE
jgi:putative tryptophan/tyrosine transport system substrate-binding protein